MRKLVVSLILQSHNDVVWLANGIDSPRKFELVDTGIGLSKLEHCHFQF